MPLGFFSFDFRIETTFSLAFEVIPLIQSQLAIGKFAEFLVPLLRDEQVVAVFAEASPLFWREMRFGNVVRASILEEKIPGGVFVQRELPGEPLLWLTRRFLTQSNATYFKVIEVLEEVRPLRVICFFEVGTRPELAAPTR